MTKTYQKKKTRIFHKIVRKIHFILGLGTGLVIFIVSLTGCIWVFNEEISGFLEDEIAISPQNRPLILPTEAKSIAQSVCNHEIHGVVYYHTQSPLEVVFYESEPAFYQSVYLHPYNGEVLKVEDHLSGFFAFILQGHRFLWLPEKIGSQLVAWSTLIFVFMLVTGIILWWPKNSRSKAQRFKFKWKTTTKWRRKNYDLHSILGFYASIFLFVIALTGLVMAFNWVGYLVYKGLGGEKEMTFSIPLNKSNDNFVDSMGIGINRLMPILLNKYKSASSLEFHYPKDEKSSIYVEISYDDYLYYNNDYRFYDQRTLKEIKTNGLYGAYENTDASDRTTRMNYDIHVGSIFGIWGKILVFILSLIAASLPLSGFLIWRGRTRKVSRC